MWKHLDISGRTYAMQCSIKVANVECHLFDEEKSILLDEKLNLARVLERANKLNSNAELMPATVYEILQYAEPKLATWLKCAGDAADNILHLQYCIHKQAFHFEWLFGKCLCKEEAAANKQKDTELDDCTTEEAFFEKNPIFPNKINIDKLIEIFETDWQVEPQPIYAGLQKINPKIPQTKELFKSFHMHTQKHIYASRSQPDLRKIETCELDAHASLDTKRKQFNETMNKTFNDKTNRDAKNTEKLQNSKDLEKINQKIKFWQALTAKYRQPMRFIAELKQKLYYGNANLTSVGDVQRDSIKNSAHDNNLYEKFDSSHNLNEQYVSETAQTDSDIKQQEAATSPDAITDLQQQQKDSKWSSCQEAFLKDQQFKRKIKDIKRDIYEATRPTPKNCQLTLYDVYMLVTERTKAAKAAGRNALPKAQPQRCVQRFNAVVNDIKIIEERQVFIHQHFEELMKSFYKLNIRNK